MALRWTPDTCEKVPGAPHGGMCVIDYQYVGGERVNEPAFYERTEQTCPAHQSLTGVVLAVAVLDESTRRQIAHSIVRGIDPFLLDAITSSHYTGQGKTRVLELSFLITVSSPTKTFIQNACDIQFGLNKTVVR